MTSFGLPRTKKIWAYGSESCEGHWDVQDPGAHDRRRGWELEEEKAWGHLIAICKCLEKVEPVFSELHSGRTRGNARILEHGKFLLDITGKQNHHVTVQTPARAAQRGCGLSTLGHTKNLGSQALSNLIYLALLEHGLFSNLLWSYIILQTRLSSHKDIHFFLSADGALQWGYPNPHQWN